MKESVDAYSCEILIYLKKLQWKTKMAFSKVKLFYLLLGFPSLADLLCVLTLHVVHFLVPFALHYAV